MEAPEMIRQGDLLFIRIAEIPKGMKPKPGKSVLAYGEVTGHSHAIVDVGETDVAVYEDDKGALCVDGWSVTRSLKHEEHDTIVLPTLYRMVRQREYDPDAVMRERQVAD